MIQPNIVEYDEDIITKPGFDLILGSNTLKEFGIVLDFYMKMITFDEISLSRRDIKKLASKAQSDKSCTISNGIYLNSPKNIRAHLRP